MTKHKLTVLDRYPEGDIDPNACIACMPARLLKTPRFASRKVKCTQCGEIVWLANDSPKGPAIVCIPCINEGIADGSIALTEVLITKRQLKRGMQ